MKQVKLVSSGLLALILGCTFTSLNVSAETVTAVCFMTGASVLNKDKVPNTPVQCYSKDGETDYKNLVAALQNGWKPLSVGIGQGEGTTKSSQQFDGGFNYAYDNNESAGIIMEKSNE
ncbi:hypothetical protein [Parashewanella tropica]|uniref:hypothetical protein n=1 Tax=Parashewanella tropica TaxID=2547970 RepID=UPI00105A9E4E|nr:hypothetical protein [Parashewanella tropica]